MTLELDVIPLLSLVAGIAILLQPGLLNYIIALYLIVVGITGIVDLKKRQEPYTFIFLTFSFVSPTQGDTTLGESYV